MLFYMNCFALFSKSERGFFYLFSLLVGIEGVCSFVEEIEKEGGIRMFIVFILFVYRS
jgi:hypothetical protein